MQVNESVRSRKPALQNACAPKSVRSKKRAHKKECAQKSVRTKKECAQKKRALVIRFARYSKEQMCSELAYEWTQDLTNHLKRFAMPLHDPEPLDTIDILDEDLEVTKYEEGQLHNLGQFLALEPKVDKLNETLAINVTLLVRLLRTTYHWQRFFSNGILSMYHTCGQALPMAIFDVST